MPGMLPVRDAQLNAWSAIQQNNARYVLRDISWLNCMAMTLATASLVQKTSFALVASHLPLSALPACLDIPYLASNVFLTNILKSSCILHLISQPSQPPVSALRENLLRSSQTKVITSGALIRYSGCYSSWMLGVVQPFSIWPWAYLLIQSLRRCWLQSKMGSLVAISPTLSSPLLKYRLKVSTHQQYHNKMKD